jgi:uncharacterized protein YlxW (UPF0749 family)
VADSSPEAGPADAAPAERSDSAADARHRLRTQLAFRPGRPHLLIGALFAVLGLITTVVVLQPQADARWRTARTEDLVQILDDLTAQQQRLDTENSRLATLQRDLEAGSTVEAVAEARRRLAALQVLSGTTAVSGPGVSIVISDPEHQVDAAVVLDAVQELRDAGAEAIQVGPARVVVDTWFGDSDEGVVADGQAVGQPIRILAIGDPNTLATAMNIPGGIGESVRTRGGLFTASTDESLTISVTVPTTVD